MARRGAPAPAALLLVLGPIEVRGPDGPIAVREGLPRRLLAALAMRMPSPATVDVLIEELWVTRRPVNARNALQAQVSYLRRCLEPVAPDLVIERYGDGYRLNCNDPAVLDAVGFERAVRALDDEVSATDPETFVRRADEALELWRGHPYADAMYDDFAQAEITRLRELHASVNERRAEMLLSLRRHTEAAASLQHLVAEYPLRESMWSALMLALYRSHRQAEALRAYSTARERLVEDLGVEPGAALRELETRILAQDPSLDAVAPETNGDVLRAEREQSIPSKHVFETHVPEPISSLVGRGFELEQIEKLVRSGRLTTLSGVGGVGKTRLAIDVARSLKELWPTRFIEFGSLPPGADVNLLIASEIGVPSVPQANPLDAVASQLGDRPSFLVFDTCEHVLDQAAVAVATLLRRNAQVRILATSRQPLGVAGETVWTVPPLELADDGATGLVEVSASGAVRLFEARAIAARADFVLDEHNASDVARICRSLDGLPLAIELAAARVNLLSPARIIERLDDRFAFLSRGARTAESRQRSLRALIEWSHDLLTDEERIFFSRLSVFGGSFDLNAAAAIAGHELESDPLDLLGALVERSLVTSTESDRFVLLDTLRAFARSRLELDDERGGAVASRARHAQWYTRLALEADPKSHGPLPDSWPILRTEAPNCLLALAWFYETDDLASGARLAGALSGFWMLEGQIVQADRWLGRFRAAPGDATTMASLMRGVGILELYQSRFEDALAAAQKSVAFARESGDGHLVASTLLTLGSTLWGVGRLDDSAHTLREAVMLFDSIGDRRGQGFALARLGRTLNTAGDATAIECLERAAGLLAEAGDGWMGCVAAEHLAQAMLRFGRVDEALEFAQAAVDLGQRVGSHAGRLAALLTLGRATLAAGNAVDACRVHCSVLASAVASGNPGDVADAIDALAHDFADADAALAVELLSAANAVRAPRNVAVASAARAARAALTERLRHVVGDARFDELELVGRRRDPAAVRVLVESRGAANA
jgi:predicted ATPase/DNA-binding SARP family transcriptional activator